MSSNLKICIVGAGVGGLAAAHTFRMHGIKNVCVLDRFSDPSRHGSFAGLGISLQPNGLAVLRKIGVLDLVLPHLYPLRDWMNGNSSGEALGPTGDIRFLRRDYGDYMFGIARSALITSIRDTLPAETLTFGYEVFGVRSEKENMENMWLKCSVGPDRKTVEEGPFDIVVAADGINSALRPTVYGKKDMATYAGLNLFYGVADMNNVDRDALRYQDHSLVQNYGRGQSFIYYGLGPTLPTTNSGRPNASFPTFKDDVFGAPAQVVWALTYRSDKAAPEGWTGLATRQALEAVVAEGQWRENLQLRALVDATALDGTDMRPAGLAHFGLFYRPPVAPWSRGGLVLLGDAAHATLPNLGQVLATPRRGVAPSQQPKTP
jgi:salicylate hydroxylase